MPTDEVVAPKMDALTISDDIFCRLNLPSKQDVLRYLVLPVQKSPPPKKISVLFRAKFKF